MKKTLSGYGIKVQTDTGHWLWLTEKGTSRYRTSALRFESEHGAQMECNMLAKANPHASFKVEKLGQQ